MEEETGVVLAGEAGEVEEERLRVWKAIGREGTGGWDGGVEAIVDALSTLRTSSTSRIRAFARRCSAIVSRRWTPELRETFAATEAANAC